MGRCTGVSEFASACSEGHPAAAALGYRCPKHHQAAARQGRVESAYRVLVPEKIYIPVLPKEGLAACLGQLTLLGKIVGIREVGRRSCEGAHAIVGVSTPGGGRVRPACG